MKEVVIVGGARTPIGSFGGQLKTVSAKELGKLAMKGVFKKLNLRPEAGAGQKEISPDKIRDAGRASIEEEAYDWDESAAPVTVDEVIMGNVLTAGLGQNPARQAMIMAGIPKETPAFTVNKVCASGLKSIALAAASIMIGQAECILAGGQESMSNAPMALPKARWGYR
ncbi:MAG: acetyl-CoA C-acyltransferase, partial [Deltaproteobacteria bacterium]|nr:acetyl-CoA C-acyltransferase [Deltaproteobacteria bacterium]